jgi:hypothetical protein
MAVCKCKGIALRASVVFICIKLTMLLQNCLLCYNNQAGSDWLHRDKPATALQPG